MDSHRKIVLFFSSIWGCGIWFFGRAMVKELNFIYEIDKKILWWHDGYISGHALGKQITY